MHYSAFFTLAGLLVAPVLSQSQCDSVASAIPACGTLCISSAATAVGCKGFNDYGCECSSSSQLVSAATACVLSACTNVVDAFAVLSGASSVCDCVKTAVPAAATPLVAIATAAGAAHVERAVPKRGMGRAPAPTPVARMAE